MVSTRLLTIDTGSVTGWAYGCTSRALPEACGEWPLDQPKHPTDPLAARKNVLENTLIDFLNAREVDLIVLADRFRGRGFHAIQAGAVYDVVVRSEALRSQITCRVEREATVREEMIGKQKRGAEWKPIIMAWCRAQGIDPDGHNAGDACVMWLWTRREIVSRQRNGAGKVLMSAA